MNNTTHYNLNKPETTDFYDIGDFNENADIIDDELFKRGNAQAIVTNNKAVALNDWVSDTTYADYAYKAEISITGVTSDHFADVVFGVAEAESGDYAPVCLTSSGKVTIYANANDAITIPTIICTKKLGG